MSSLSNTALLQCSDVGNVLPLSRVRPGGASHSKCPPQSDGLMNTGLVDYRRCQTSDGKPNDLDIGQYTPGVRYSDKGVGTYGLAGFFQVAPNTCRRWFGMNARVATGSRPVDPQNCVPVNVVGSRLCQLPAENTIKVPRSNPATYRTYPGSQPRALFAASLVVRDTDAQGAIVRRPCAFPGAPGKSPVVSVESGGLQREPIFHQGDRHGNPYVDTHDFNLMASALDWLWRVYTERAGVLLQQGWVQMTIEPSGTASAPKWTANTLYFYPSFADESDYDEAATAEEEGR